MKTNDYVKYMTQQFVQYMDQPKEERKTKKFKKRRTSTFCKQMVWSDSAVVYAVVSKEKRKMSISYAHLFFNRLVFC